MGPIKISLFSEVFLPYIKQLHVEKEEKSKKASNSQRQIVCPKSLSDKK